MRVRAFSILMLSWVIVIGVSSGTVGAAPTDPEGAAVPQVDPRAVGAVIGGILAHRVARGMDEADRRMAAEQPHITAQDLRTALGTGADKGARRSRSVLPGAPDPPGWDWDTGKTAELDALFVRPALMRHGIGARLVEDAARGAREAGAPLLVVTANPRAEAFYARCGFRTVGEAPTRFGPAIRMYRDLAPP